MAYSLTIPKAVVPLVSVSLSCTTYYMVGTAALYCWRVSNKKNKTTHPTNNDREIKTIEFTKFDYRECNLSCKKHNKLNGFHVNRKPTIQAASRSDSPSTSIQ